MKFLLHKFKKRFLRDSAQETPLEFSHSDFFFEQELGNVIFIDNRFQNGFDQIVHYFKSGFLHADNTCVVFKYYPQNYNLIREICDAKNIHWFCFTANKFIPSFTDKLFLYPFNSASNARMVANRRCYHVLLMHGESNKVACVKPLARLYDHVLVAGDLACERLVEYGILTQNDVSSGRVIKMGLTVLGDFNEFKRAQAGGEKGALGYFPTWEGGNDEENVSSLEYIKPAILKALDVLNTKHVVMHVHPNTGDRFLPYKGHVKNLIQLLLEKGYQVTYAVINRPTSFEMSLKEAFKSMKWYKVSETEPLSLAAAIVDVSALEAVLDAKLIPNLVYVNPDREIAPPKRYWSLKQNQHIFGPDKTGLETGFSFDDEAAETYRKALISYSDARLEAMPQSERIVWLNEYVRKQKVWPSL